MKGKNWTGMQKSTFRHPSNLLKKHSTVNTIKGVGMEEKITAKAAIQISHLQLESGCIEYFIVICMYSMS
jgi:hypothetical protein